MAEATRQCVYFSKPGKHNTDPVIDAVLRATYPNDLLSQDPDKRLRIHEVLCKPR